MTTMPTTLAPLTRPRAASTDVALRTATVDVVKSLAAQFPQLAANASDRVRMVDEWSLGLAGMSEREIERGIAECRTRKFAPSLGEFAQFCRPALDPECAWVEAQDGLAARERGEPGVWSHPAVWRAAAAMAFEIRSGSLKTCRKRWEMTLRREFEAGWGEPVPPVAERVEHQPSRTVSPEKAKAILADLRLLYRGVKK